MLYSIVYWCFKAKRRQLRKKFMQPWYSVGDVMGARRDYNLAEERFNKWVEYMKEASG